MRYIGFDLGTKTLGVSVSDNLGLIASAYKTIRFNENDYESLLKEVENVLKEFNTKVPCGNHTISPYFIGSM